jgi:hypothetical protein
LRKTWKARDRIARRVCRRVSCSAFLAKPRRNSVDGRKRLGGGLGVGVRTRHTDRGLAGMACAHRDRGQKQGPAGDRLAMETGIGEAVEVAPPIQLHHARLGALPARGATHRAALRPQPHWVFISLKMFSPSPRSR